MAVVFTAFEPFGKLTENPSAQVLEAFAAQVPELVWRVLPTAYAPSMAVLSALLTETRPSALVMLGVDETGMRLALEYFGLNMQNARMPDNEGAMPRHQAISETGPAAYRSTLPLAEIQERWRVARIPNEVSYNAGTFVCNHVFYSAMRWLDEAGLAIPAGFIHVPPLTVLPLARQVEALRGVYEELGGQFQT